MLENKVQAPKFINVDGFGPYQTHLNQDTELYTVHYPLNQDTELHSAGVCSVK